MIKESAFRQKEVYANRVLIYAQNGKIYELSSDMNELGEIGRNCNKSFGIREPNKG